EVLAHLFEPYFTTKERGKGTGLGLATVYGIVKQSGGNIWVYSEPGKGTTVKIYFPRTLETHEKVGTTARRTLPRGTETILIVEDDDAVRKLAVTILKERGYHVIEAHGAESGLQLARTHDGRIHLLLTDVVLRDGEGPHVVRHVLESRPDTKVLYMSGYTDDAIVQHGVLPPGTAFLQKPFTPQGLAAKMREVLDGEDAEGDRGR
ncbi:MAG: response regulator, partial [Planctomycetes bacterium]|nr:response regulator [Planctomycetota bacterium]